MTADYLFIDLLYIIKSEAVTENKESEWKAQAQRQKTTLNFSSISSWTRPQGALNALVSSLLVSVPSLVG